MAQSMEEVKVRKTTLDEYEIDPDNVNAGTDEGRAIIGQSIQSDGAGRSLLVDATGRLIAGNQTKKAAIEAGVREVIEVTTKGEALIVHRREDLLPGDVEREHLMIADNRATELGLKWNPDAVLRRLQAGVSLVGMWQPEEIKAKFAPVLEQAKAALQEDSPTDEEMEAWEWDEEDAEGETESTMPLSREEKTYHFKFDLSFEDSIVVDRAMKEFELAENRDRLEFLIYCAELYLKGEEIA